MFVCYAKDHAQDCYVMFNPQTLNTMYSRDVLWLNRMNFPDQKRPGAPIILIGPPPPLALQSVDKRSVVADSSTVASAESEEENNSVAESTDEYLEQSKGKTKAKMKAKHRKQVNCGDIWKKR